MNLLKYSLVFIFILVIVVISYIFIIDNNKVKIKLDKCVDGDTAWFIVEENRTKVRFLGIDTPESTSYVEEYGIDASNYTCDLLENANDIYIEFDRNSEERDKYNRLLGYVFVDGNNLSELLLSRGLAEVKYIYGDYKYIDNLCNSQYEAFKNKLGIWKLKDYKDNYCYKIMS